MKKYKVLSTFFDKETKKEYTQGSFIELSEARAKEVLAFPNYKLIEEVQDKPKVAKRTRTKKVEKDGE